MLISSKSHRHHHNAYVTQVIVPGSQVPQHQQLEVLSHLESVDLATYITLSATPSSFTSTASQDPQCIAAVYH